MALRPNKIENYPDEALLEEVRRAAELVNKPVLTGADFTRLSGIAAGILRKRFGGWQETLERAGLAHMFSRNPEHLPNQPRKYSDEELLEEMRRVAGVVDKPVITGLDVKKLSRIDAKQFRKRFGGWQQALERAGLAHMFSGEPGNHARHWLKYSDEELLEELRRVAKLVGKQRLRRIDFNKYSEIPSETLAVRFGRWQNALERADLAGMYIGGIRKIGANYSNEELLKKARQAADLVNGPVLTGPEFQRLSGIDRRYICQRFGNWRSFLECAGLAHMYHDSKRQKSSWIPKYSDDHLLAELRRAAGLVDKSVLTERDFAKHSKVGRNTMLNRFGTWRNALDRAGLAHMNARPQSRLCCPRRSDEELLEELRRVAGLVGKPMLTAADFEKISEISHGPIRHRFGSWQKGLERAGLAHMFAGSSENLSRLFRKHSDEELLQELRRVAALVGNPGLSRADFEKHSAIRSHVLTERFGGWPAVRKCAGLSYTHKGNSKPHRYYADAELLEELRRVSTSVDKPVISQSEFMKHSNISIRTLSRRFGSWQEVLERAGLAHKVSRTS